MKMYNKPTIEFIELKPEERLACASGGTSTGGCGYDDKPSYFGWFCGSSFPWGKICSIKWNNKHCH